MIMTVGRSSRTPSFGQLDGLGREGDEQEKQEGQEQEEKKEEVKEREEEEEKTDEEGAHEAAYVDQGDQGDGWIPVSPRRRKRSAQVTGDAQMTSDDPLGEEETSYDHWAGPGLPIGYAQKDRICDHTGCYEIIYDHTYRLFPTYCSKCLEVWIKVQERSRLSEYSHV